MFPFRQSHKKRDLTIYNAQGADVRAEPLLVRALDIREKARGATHPDVADSLNNLALIYKVVSL